MGMAMRGALDRGDVNKEGASGTRGPLPVARRMDRELRLVFLTALPSAEQNNRGERISSRSSQRYTRTITLRPDLTEFGQMTSCSRFLKSMHQEAPSSSEKNRSIVYNPGYA
jgi:hypothetical protein